MTNSTIKTLSVSRVDDIEAEAWNRLVPDDAPFVQHAFLANLERSGCVGGSTGWTPDIQLLYTQPPDGEEELIGAVPLYLKDHSAGEFVFDWAWADAAQRAGIQYYPKAVVGVPFTPVTGPRLLVSDSIDDPGDIKKRLIERAIEVTESKNLSSLHINFLPPPDVKFCRDRNLIVRKDFQYHWQNEHRLGPESGQRYEDFDDFLAEFRSKKRSNIKRERRRLREDGVTTTVKTGEEVTSRDLDRMFEYYRNTVRKFFYGNQYLNRDFFRRLGDNWSEYLHLVTAQKSGEIYAGALNAATSDTLYGRYWGQSRDIDFTHFEVCFYQSIEWCIDNDIGLFEGGSGGDHKFDRGFTPSYTYSAHYLRDPRLSQAVERSVHQETRAIENKVEELKSNSPFKEHP